MMPRRHLDIEALRALVGIVDTESFSTTAQQLGRTQSAVSLQIKRLELTVGQTLLHRVQGRVDGPTAEGAALLGYARQILRLNDEAYATVAQDAAPGTLRVGLPEELMEGIFSAVMPQFQVLYPRLRLFLQADTSIALRQSVADGALDVAIYKYCGDAGSSADQVIWREPLVWMVGEAYRDTFALQQREALPLALFGENCVFRLAVTSALVRENIPWALQYTGSSTTGLSHAVRCGLGVTALPRSLLGPGMALLANGALPDLPPAQLLVAYAAGSVSVAAGRFVRLVSETLAQRNLLPAA